MLLVDAVANMTGVGFALAGPNLHISAGRERVGLRLGCTRRCGAGLRLGPGFIGGCCVRRRPLGLPSVVHFPCLCRRIEPSFFIGGRRRRRRVARVAVDREVRVSAVVAILERRAAGEWLVGRNAGLGDLGFDFAADWRGRRGLPDDRPCSARASEGKAAAIWRQQGCGPVWPALTAVAKSLRGEPESNARRLFSRLLETGLGWGEEFERAGIDDFSQAARDRKVMRTLVRDARYTIAFFRTMRELFPDDPPMFLTGTAAGGFYRTRAGPTPAPPMNFLPGAGAPACRRSALQEPERCGSPSFLIE
jgi:hypothetical protein